jgi:hypothetical protein
MALTPLTFWLDASVVGPSTIGALQCIASVSDGRYHQETTLNHLVPTMQDKKQKLAFDRPKSTMKNIRFEDELLEQIEKAAGKGQFSAWVKEACRMRLTTRK